MTRKVSWKNPFLVLELCWLLIIDEVNWCNVDFIHDILLSQKKLGSSSKTGSYSNILVDVFEVNWYKAAKWPLYTLCMFLDKAKQSLFYIIVIRLSTICYSEGSSLI